MKGTAVFNNIEVKNASWLITGRIIQMSLSFLISIFTTRYLGPNNFGIINYATAYVTFFTSLCTLGLNSIAVKEIIGNQDKQGEVIGTMIGLRFVSSILSSITIIGIVSIVDKDEPLTIAAAALCSAQLVFHIFDTFNYWFQSKYQSKVTAIATLIAYIAISIYRIILLILQKSVLWFAFATSVDYMVLGIILFVAYTRSGGNKLFFSLERAKDLLGKSYHYILSGMMVAIYTQTDKIMLKQMMSETSVGYYSLATSVNVMWEFVLQAIIDSVYPTIVRLYEEDYSLYEKKNRQLYAIVMYISFFVAIAFILLGHFFIVVVYGTEFEQSADTLKILAWLTAFSYLGVARNAWIVCENQQKHLKYLYSGAAIINIVLNLALIPIFGVIGAATASLITQIFTSIVLPSLVKDLRPNVKLMLDALLLKNIK